MPVIVDAIMIAVILVAAIVALAELMMPLNTPLAADLPVAEPSLYDWRALDDIDRRVRPDLVWHDDWSSAGAK